MLCTTRVSGNALLLSFRLLPVMLESPVNDTVILHVRVQLCENFTQNDIFTPNLKFADSADRIVDQACTWKHTLDIFFNLKSKFWRLVLRSDPKRIAFPKTSFQLPRPANALEFSTCHDGEAITKDIGFLHRMRGQNHRLASF